MRRRAFTEHMLTEPAPHPQASSSEYRRETRVIAFLRLELSCASISLHFASSPAPYSAFMSCDLFV